LLIEKEFEDDCKSFMHWLEKSIKILDVANGYVLIRTLELRIIKLDLTLIVSLHRNFLFISFKLGPEKGHLKAYSL
jgi:hypothetical protein